MGALDYIVQAERLSDGKRKIMNISEVSVDEDNKIQIRDIFTFKRTGMGANGEVLGYHTATGLIPKALERIRIFGIKMDERLFTPKEEYLYERNDLHSPTV